MARDPLLKLQSLVTRATRPTDANDEEARTAAVQACHLLQRHPELLAPPAPAGLAAPLRRNNASTEHPEAARLREWRAMVDAKDLWEGSGSDAGICADCGGAIEAGAEVVASVAEHLTTHRGCAGWWWRYEVPARQPRAPPEEDIQF